MNKPLKYSLIGAAGLLLLAIAAAGVFLMLFDANRYKPQVERLVKEKTGRTLKLQGPLEAAVWPGLGAKVSGVTLSERGSEQPFVSLDNAHASVALLPLLRGRVVVDRIRLSGFKATVVKQKDGRFNFSDLIETKEGPSRAAAKEPQSGGAPVAFDVAGIEIDKSAVVYRDLAAGKEYSVSDFNLGTGRIRDKADGKLQLRAAVKAPDLDVKLDLSADYKLDLPGLALANLNLKVSGKEETNVRGRIALARVTTFDLNIDRLNVDAYLPAAQKPAASASAAEKPAADTPVDLSALKDLNADGQLQIGALQVHGLKLANVKTEVKAANGQLTAPHSASLYEGTLDGTLGAHADGRIALKDALHDVAVGPLLRDAAQQDKLEGKGNLTLDVNAAGKSVNAMKRSLAGTAKVELHDGAIKGIDIAAVLGKAKSSAEKSAFTEMSASFVIKNGVAHNDDLDVKSPLFRLTGRGDIDVGNSTINYVTTASLSGHAVPVRLSGPFDNLKYDVNYGAVAADVAKSKVGERLQERLKERLFGR